MGKKKGAAARRGGPPQRWSAEKLRADLEEHGSAEAVARHYGLSGGTIRNLVKRYLGPQPTRAPAHTTPGGGGPEKSGVTRKGDYLATAALPPGAELGDLDALLRARGLDPADWIVDHVTVNEWEALAYGGGPDGPPRTVVLHQLKAHLIHKGATVRPAADVAQRYVPVAAPPPPGQPELVVVCGDQQAPYYDHALHAALLRWLTDLQPQRGVFTGDTMDFPTISRHADRLRWSASAQECADSAFGLISDVRDASPLTRWQKLRGNHDWRLESELMTRAERMAFLAPAALPGEEREPHLYSVRRLLHLDRLGVELCGREGEDWRMGEVALVPGTVVRHEPTGALKTARLNRNVMAGHTHRQGITGLTVFDNDNVAHVRTVVEVGALADVREGLGYVDRPDWQQGFATATIHPDGQVSFDLATWRNGVLTWCGERW